MVRGVGAEARLIDPRQILQAPNMQVITEQFTLPRVHQAFDTDGRLVDPRQNEQMTKMMRRLIDVASRPA